MIPAPDRCGYCGETEWCQPGCILESPDDKRRVVPADLLELVHVVYGGPASVVPVDRPQREFCRFCGARRAGRNYRHAPGCYAIARRPPRITLAGAR